MFSYPKRIKHHQTMLLTKTIHPTFPQLSPEFQFRLDFKSLSPLVTMLIFVHIVAPYVQDPTGNLTWLARKFMNHASSSVSILQISTARYGLPVVQQNYELLQIFSAPRMTKQVIQSTVGRDWKFPHHVDFHLPAREDFHPWST